MLRQNKNTTPLTNELMGTSKEKIPGSFKKIMNNDWKTGQRPKFWDGNASERIIKVIENQ